ncbi:MAG: diacylglycerol kinase family protein [Oscillospiraceae bacterium]
MKSFKFAFRGIASTIANERNMRIHLCFAFYVIAAGIATKIAPGEWMVLLVCIGLVTALECVNTAVESLCDTLHPEYSKGIKLTKDAAAGAVLLAAIFSAAAGGIIFFNAEKVKAALDFFNSCKLLSIILIISLIPAVFFVRGRKRDKK